MIERNAREIKENGFFVQKRMLSNLDLDCILNMAIPAIAETYTEDFVEKRLFRKREDTPGRKGDAVLMSIEEPEKAPFLIIDDRFPCIGSLYLSYVHTLSQFLYGDFRLGEDTKVLVNYQQYKEGASNSLPFHFDAEIFKGDWNKEYIELEEGLIPRLVMVVVLENENYGKKGLQVVKPSGEVIDLDLRAGDILYFDNTAVLHGVPEDLDKKRTMIGFRSFEIDPLYFRKDGFLDATDVIKIDTPYVKGEAIELSTEEAKEMLNGEGWYY
jgi:hypothetical protein